MADTEKTLFDGLAGVIDCVIEHPESPPRGWALVLHPHPLHGGARDNKIVTTIARACVQDGLVAVRPNFRGVGGSAGEFDSAVGETQDMRELVRQFAQRYPQAAAGKWVLAGFSFGTSVAAQLYSMMDEDRRQALGAQAGQSGAMEQQARVADSAVSGAHPVPDALILVGSAVQRFKFRDITVPDDAMLVHGEMDEVVPLSEAMEFARSNTLPMVVVPDGSHFFHGKLVMLRKLVQDRLAALWA